MMMMMKRGGGVDSSSGVAVKKSIYMTQGAAGTGVGGGVGGGSGRGAGTSRKLKNISAYSSPYGLM